LIEGAREIAVTNENNSIQIEGVDLVGMFTANPFGKLLTLKQQAVELWKPMAPCALITCVHGLHYIGDKLGLIVRLVDFLAPDGLLLANFDLASIRFADGRPAGRTILPELKRHGLQYDGRRKLIRCEGHRTITLNWEFVGADDAAGPNYTGQAAVNSWYSPAGGAKRSDVENESNPARVL
jgi:hypothetical protein